MVSVNVHCSTYHCKEVNHGQRNLWKRHQTKKQLTVYNSSEFWYKMMIRMVRHDYGNTHLIEVEGGWRGWGFGVCLLPRHDKEGSRSAFGAWIDPTGEIIMREPVWRLHYDMPLYMFTLSRAVVQKEKEIRRWDKWNQCFPARMPTWIPTSGRAREYVSLRKHTLS